MFWLWLGVAARHRCSWGTGPLQHSFTFGCAQCGASFPAVAWSTGMATGPTQLSAQRRAHDAATAFAYAAAAAAACPNCNALQPSIQAGFALATKRANRNRALRIPLALLAAILLGIAIGIPAAADLHHSVTLAVVATSVATAAGALVFAIFASPVTTPNANPAGIWFSRDPSQGPQSWFPAQPGMAPYVPQPPRLLRTLSLVALGLSALSTLVAGVAYSKTFRKVYVVSAEDIGQELTVSIDGGPPQLVTQNATDDAPNLITEVRTDSSHTVVVQAGEGGPTTYTLDPRTAGHGWVIAPRGLQRGLCLASITWYYGTKPKQGDDKLLNEKSEIAPLGRSFNYVFESPPAKIETNNSSETRTSMRALDCAALARDEHVPFKNRDRRVQR